MRFLQPTKSIKRLFTNRIMARAAISERIKGKTKRFNQENK